MHSGNINNLSYYYFPEALSTLLFSSKISLDNICTEKIISKSFKFIKKYALKLILENNNKKKFFSLQLSAAQLAHARGPASSARCSGPRRPNVAQQHALGFLSSAAASEPFIISDGCPFPSRDQNRVG